MSRVAKAPIELPEGVEAKIIEEIISIKGKLGVLQIPIHASVEIKQEDNVLKFAPRNTEKHSRAMAGTTRSLVNGMVQGVTQGFEKKLILQGVGYRAKASNKTLDLSLGFSHPVVFDVPEGIVIETPTQTEIIVKGINKQMVGEVAARIRRYRPPEPYKGKGIRYADEIIRRKEAKKK